ncbi:hypothetical protein GCM10009676_09030 [Prauserella halophila]|uniref:YrhK domain-containing protein n=1 Tax=Prauserella halophila TaxID=185641 RepID=A0ABP4GQG1_9PSEU|nr:YrhK family protein [Prauserella halophila]MCP2235259.1 YrhK-like protein [Prauserella halophila]
MSTSSSGHTSGTGVNVIHIGHHELVIRQRYEVISIVNDLLIGTWFLIGSVFFFYPGLTFAGTWLFVAGSVEMLIRPSIRFVRRVHLKRFNPDRPGTADAAHDF